MRKQKSFVSDITRAFQALERPGQMETTVCIQYRASAVWSWVMIRYPSDIRDQRPTETVFDFTGMKWLEILEWVKTYLIQHPEDGFAFT